MISVDTDILFASVVPENPNHEKAAAFMDSLHSRDDIAISEFFLLELYVLLRNPAVVTRPLQSNAAVDVCQKFRSHSRWQIVGFPLDSQAFHDDFWLRLTARDFARRRSYDWRTALSLLRQGVTEFATPNEKDFRDFGFKWVWNPLADQR